MNINLHNLLLEYEKAWENTLNNGQTTLATSIEVIKDGFVTIGIVDPADMYLEPKLPTEI